MIKEVKSQTKVAVGVDVLWKAMAKDLVSILPKVLPHLVKDAQIIEGDGGLSTIYLFNFGPDVKNMTYQKEKITELDESLHRITMEVIEGGHLECGFSQYRTTFQLIAMGENETLVDVTVAYQSEMEDDNMPLKTVSSTSSFVKHLENYLVNSVS